MTISPSLSAIPDIILIIGTDAAGKDHVANIVAKMISEAGGSVEKRKRFLSGKVTSEASSTNKSKVDLVLEKIFLFLYPYLGKLLPLALDFILKRDLQQFRQPDEKLVVVGHNCLRGLAFHWGHRRAGAGQIRVPMGLQSTLHNMRSLKGLHVLVLDVEDKVRRKRISQRHSLGEADFFDLYMAENSERSERIESVLVWLTQEYLNGQLIENNDLAESDLRLLLQEGFAASTQQTIKDCIAER